MALFTSVCLLSIAQLSLFMKLVRCLVEVATLCAQRFCEIYLVLLQGRLLQAKFRLFLIAVWWEELG